MKGRRFISNSLGIQQASDKYDREAKGQYQRHDTKRIVTNDSEPPKQSLVDI